MRTRDTDGNLAALRQYEQEQDRQDEAWECIQAQISPLVSQVADLLDQVHSLAETEEYDFSESVLEYIQDRLDGLV